MTNLTNRYRCVLCGTMQDGYGNNPAPLKEKGRCCDKCNILKVVPLRIKKWTDYSNYKKAYEKGYKIGFKAGQHARKARK